MTALDSSTIANVPTETLAATAEALIRSGQPGRARDLLDATTSQDLWGRARLALAVAAAAIDSDYRTGTALAPERLSAAGAAVGAADDAQLRWDLAHLELRHSYFDALFDGSTPRLDSRDRDPHQIESLRDGAERLYTDSPDTGRRGWASVLQGWIADNISGDRGAAPAHYREALGCAESTGDDYLAFEALRHLGDHDHDDGDHERARKCWEESTAHAARAGSVPGTLAQQLLLAVLHRDAGDEGKAQALAREIVRWADAIGAHRLEAQAQAFVDGVDITAPPPGDDR